MKFSIDALADVAGEARRAGVRELLITEGDDGADRRRVLALDVRKAGADVERGAIGELDQQRAEAALVTTHSGDVTEHARFGVLEALHLQQRVRAAGLVAGLRLADHQPLASEPLDAGELGAEVLGAVTQLVFVRDEPGHLQRTQGGLDERHALFEHADVRGRVEHDVLELLPEIRFVLPLHDAHRALELLSAAEELAVERRLRERGGEPLRREELVAEARDEALAVPVRAHAVEFFREPPAGEVDVVLPLVREEHRRPLVVVGLGAGVAGRARRLRRFRGPAREIRGAQAQRLGLVTAIRAQVLAGAPLDAQALVPPRGAGAGVHAAGVLERVDGSAGALHFRALSIGEIRGHGPRSTRQGLAQRQGLERQVVGSAEL